MKLNEQIEEYKKLGERWARGEVYITDWQVGDKKIVFTDTQAKFVNERSRYTLAAGGIASGKTFAFLIKLIILSLFFPGNRILLGRKTRTNVEASLLPDFFDLCPPEWIKYKVGPGVIEFFNGSEIIIKGLDVLQSSAESDLKKALADIRGLNLGGIFIDQLEEIEMKAFEALQDRMRRDVGFNQFNATTNPANYWAYDYFKENPRANTKYILFSTMENKGNLPESFIQDRLSMGESYVRRYIYGEWTPELMTESSVFPSKLLEDQKFFIKEPLSEVGGIKIFEEPSSLCHYQVGVDPSEGVQDPCNIQVINTDTGAQAASYSGFVPVDVIAKKAIQMAYMYSTRSKPLMVIESNSTGLAVIEKIKMEYDNLYERETFNYRTRMNTKKIGFNTNFQTKKLLIEHFLSLLERKYVKIREEQLLNELRTFIYTNSAQQKGAGAQPGFHDDRVMAFMLACWRFSPSQTAVQTLDDTRSAVRVMQTRSKKQSLYN